MPVTKRDYYEILGVQKGASTDEIKRAYRTMAMKHHPDRVGAEHKKEAEERFKEISEAYAVLTDPKKRSVYDQYGHAGFDQRYSTEDIFRGADFSSIFEDLGFGGSIFEDLFGGSGFFGMGREGGRGSRGSDLEVQLPLSFEEAARGVAKTVTVPRHELCSECRGEGGERAGCPSCKGAGQIRQSAGFMVIARTCPRCGGHGSVVKKACSHCRGQGRVRVERQLEVKVPPGVESGMRLRLSGEGEPGTRGRGDLYVYLSVDPHSIFQREGANLLIDCPITITQASLGAEIEVPSLNGRISMKVPAGTQSGTVFRVRGKGLPDVRDGRPGDLLVRAIVETPTRLNGSQRRLMEELERALAEEAHPVRRSFLEKLKQLVR
ncbi:MAG: molecular chaperone DnaJ [Candidatus Omnitrophica bacterium]|nr:molecular chaperone DnaJ [Candidatus Omnitrophota bacterium]